jgi:hypothetical protein
MIISGDGITILVNATNTAMGAWSSFGLYYSIRKFLPNAELLLNRNRNVSKGYFNWMPRLGVKLLKSHKPDIVLSSLTIMAREINGDELVSEAKEDKFTPFVSYENGCGKFVVSEWINKEAYPFPYADDFVTDQVCANEIQILRLWKQMNNAYSLLAES